MGKSKTARRQEIMTFWFERHPGWVVLGMGGLVLLAAYGVDTFIK